jgi:hypothetical protein
LKKKWIFWILCDIFGLFGVPGENAGDREAEVRAKMTAVSWRFEWCRSRLLNVDIEGAVNGFMRGVNFCDFWIFG